MPTGSNKVFIATSLDGYIADRNGGLDWLTSIPNPDHLDMGYSAFMEGIDALVMGRKTFETVCSFEMDWPYQKPVFVLSNTLQSIDSQYAEKAFLVKGTPKAVIHQVHQRGFYNLYIDGGKTIQGFLKEDLIDELIITTIPIILGGGIRLFTETSDEQKYSLVKTEVLLDQLIQCHYKRSR